MRSRRAHWVLALTAVIVVVWSSVAAAGNGDPVTAGAVTSATAQTALKTSQSAGAGFVVQLSGSSTGAAVRAIAIGSGRGLQATADNPNTYGVYGANTSASTGVGAGGYFVGGANHGVIGRAGDGRAGVLGQNTGNGFGVQGTSSTGPGIQGMTGTANSYGVYGTNSSAASGSGAGGYFVGGANNGVFATAGDGHSGVLGQNTGNGNGLAGASAYGNGVYGRANWPGQNGVYGLNTAGNGVKGQSDAFNASGVYGENTGGGYGVAGRANVNTGGLGPSVGTYGEAIGAGDGHGVAALSDGPGGAVLASNSGPGPALELHNDPTTPPMTVDSSEKVNNLNADRVDGASILSNRIISSTQGDHILQLPGFGDVNVDGCDHANVRIVWSSGGPNAYLTAFDLVSGAFTSAVANLYTSGTTPNLFTQIQLARNVGASTTMATVTVTAHAADCVFAAQAVVQPG